MDVNGFKAEWCSSRGVTVLPSTGGVHLRRPYHLFWLYILWWCLFNITVDVLTLYALIVARQEKFVVAVTLIAKVTKSVVVRTSRRKRLFSSQVFFFSSCSWLLQNRWGGMAKGVLIWLPANTSFEGFLLDKSTSDWIGTGSRTSRSWGMQMPGRWRWKIYLKTFNIIRFSAEAAYHEIVEYMSDWQTLQVDGLLRWSI